MTFVRCGLFSAERDVYVLESSHSDSLLGLSLTNRASPENSKAALNRRTHKTCPRQSIMIKSKIMIKTETKTAGRKGLRELHVL